MFFAFCDVWFVEEGLLVSQRSKKIFNRRALDFPLLGSDCFPSNRSFFINVHYAYRSSFCDSNAVLFLLLFLEKLILP